jgi:hypothetical protein
LRCLIAALLLAVPLLGQAPADFSGVFLRTATTVGKKRSESEIPRILVIKQDSNEVVVQAIQNGETAEARYPFDVKKSDKVQARLKGRSLVLTFSLVGQETSISEKWQLSSDGHELTIHGEQGLLNESEIYERKHTLEEAQAEVNRAVKSACKRPFPFSQKAKKDEPTSYHDGAFLGMATTSKSRAAFSTRQSCPATSSKISKHLSKLAPRSGNRAERLSSTIAN